MSLRQIFLNFDGSGLLCKCVTLYVLLYIKFFFYSGHNYPTRLETRTKEFNWIASRRVYHKTHLNIYGAAKAKLCDVFCNRDTATQADYVYA